MMGKKKGEEKKKEMTEKRRKLGIQSKKRERNNVKEKAANAGKVQKLRTKLITAFLLPTLLFIVAGFFISQLTSNTLENTYKKNASASVATLGDYYSLLLDNVELMGARLSVNVDIIDYYSGGVKRANLKMANVKNAINSEAIADKYIEHIMIISPNETCFGERGKIKADLYNAFLNSEEGKYVAELGERAKCWISAHPSIDAETGYSADDYAMSYVKAMTNSGNKIIGYVVIDVKRSFVQEILAYASNSSKSQEALVLPDGVQIEVEPGDTIFSQESFFQNAMSGEAVNGSFYVNVKGTKKLFSYRVFGENMAVCSLIPHSQIVSSARIVAYVTIITILVCAAFSILIGTLISDNISKALYSVNGVLKKTSEGDLTGEVTVKRKDEFAILGSNLTETIRSMKNLISKMTNVSLDVSGSAEAVNSNSQVLMDVTDHITSAVGNINDGIARQAEDTQSCMVQMNELADKITQVHERTNHMSELAVGTQSAVENGMHSVKDLESKVEDSTLCTKEIVQEIQALNQASEDISSIVVTMNAIAEETNLLSLNASIEAARAGEAGRGFAVVSEEIRKLADQSAQAAARIGEIIMEVQARVNATMETAVKTDGIVSAQTEALVNTISIFEEISTRVGDMENAVRHILNSVNRIEAAKEDTMSAIMSISETAHETENVSTILGEGSSQLLDTANQLNDAVQMLRENAVDLDNSVKIFRIQ